MGGPPGRRPAHRLAARALRGPVRRHRRRPGGGRRRVHQLPGHRPRRPARNTGAPWQTLYFGDNHRRLRRVKAKWDPRDVFRHALSVRAA
ncbi:BBE domain-containing protein [Streptomyces sp. NPDC048384]|uniref:BBE domain-containing protein n=1 Tax=Streptomyces sp. NPDC048384 TaxID=3155487 RepID=UPI00343281CA